jgi:ABC-type phosphate transport system substrate-binding protein
MNRLILLFIFLLPLLSACNEPTVTPTKGSLNAYTDETLLPLIIKEKDAFTARYPEAKVKVVPLITNEGIEKILNGKIEMFVSPRTFTNDEQKFINDHKVDIKTYNYCYSGIAVISSRESNISKISSDDLKDLLKNKGKSSNIKVYIPSENSGIYDFIKDDYLDGQTPSGAVVLAGDKEIKEAVKKQPNSIGLTEFNLVKDTSDLKVIPVGVLNYQTKNIVYYIPHPAYFIHGDYPLTYKIYVFINDKHFGVATGFTSFLTSTEGQKVVLSENLAPGTVPVKLVSHN